MDSDYLVESLALREAATLVRARRGQRLALSVDCLETLYIVRSGALALTGEVPGRGDPLLCVAYPGEVLRSEFAPPLAGAAFVVLTTSEAWRMPRGKFEGLWEADPKLALVLDMQQRRQISLAYLRLAVLRALTAEERVVTFFVELAMRAGRPAGAGMSFSIPMTREDISNYLDLNADTLSRTVARLERSGLLKVVGRGQGIIPDFKRLCELCPVSVTLQTLFGCG